MLTFLRGHGTKWLVKIVLWALVLAFVGTMGLVWGYGKEKGERPVARVGNHAITQIEYRRQYENMLRRLQDMAGGSLTHEMVKQMNLEKTALDSLIMEKLQLKAAKDAGMQVSEDEIRQDIEKTPAFQRDGHFDRDAYFGTLRGNNLSPRDYERMLKQDIMIRKMAEVITDSVQTTNQEVLDVYNRENEEIKLRYFEVLPAAFTAEALKGADKGLEAYFTSNASRFMRPEQRTVQLIYADLPKDVKEDDAAKKKLYAILNGGAGKDFNAQAKDNGFRFEEWTRTAAQMASTDADATRLAGQIFRAKEGEAAGPVQMANAAVIFKVVKITPPSAPKLDEVRKEVEAAYVKDESMRRAGEAASKAAERLNNGDAFAAVAGSAKVVESKPFKRADTVEGLPGGPRTVAVAFGLKEKAAGSALTDNGFVVMVVEQRTLPPLAGLADQRAKLSEALLSRKREEAVIAWQSSLREEANKNGLIKIEEKTLL